MSEPTYAELTRDEAIDRLMEVEFAISARMRRDEDIRKELRGCSCMCKRVQQVKKWIGDCS